MAWSVAVSAGVNGTQSNRVRVVDDRPRDIELTVEVINGRAFGAGLIEIGPYAHATEIVVRCRSEAADAAAVLVARTPAEQGGRRPSPTSGPGPVPLRTPADFRHGRRIDRLRWSAAFPTGTHLVEVYASLRLVASVRVSVDQWGAVSVDQPVQHQSVARYEVVANGEPVEGAHVWACSDDEVLDRARTNVEGVAHLRMSRDVTVYVLARGFQMVQHNTPVAAIAPSS